MTAEPLINTLWRNMTLQAWAGSCQTRLTPTTFSLFMATETYSLLLRGGSLQESHPSLVQVRPDKFGVLNNFFSPVPCSFVTDSPLSHFS